MPILAFEDCNCCPVYGQCAEGQCIPCEKGYYTDSYNQSICEACNYGYFNK